MTKQLFTYTIPYRGVVIARFFCKFTALSTLMRNNKLSDVYALRIYVCLFETVRQKYDFISFPYNTQTGIYLQKNQSQMMDYT